MNADLETLARRAVACPRFRWLPGMLLRYPPARGAMGQQVYSTNARVTDLPQPLGRGYGVIEPSSIGPGASPDLTDPATLGCLLALVREAFGDPSLFAECHPVGARWQIHSVDGGIFGEGDSEAAALVAALEAAPE